MRKLIYLLLLPLAVAVTACGGKKGSSDNQSLPSQSEFFVISKHFTATPRIPPTSTALKTTSINCNFTVEPQTFTADLIVRLRSL